MPLPDTAAGWGRHETETARFRLNTECFISPLKERAAHRQAAGIVDDHTPHR